MACLGGANLGATAYPLIFTYQEIVRGKGFLAAVQTRGRALMVREDGEWWMYGAQPGGLDEGGASFEEARLKFREAFREILFDIAASVVNFAEFERDVQRFVTEPSEPMVSRWQAAVELIRSKKMIVESPLDQLPRQPNENEVEVLVAELKEPAKSQPTDNRADYYAIPALAA